MEANQYTALRRFDEFAFADEFFQFLNAVSKFVRKDIPQSQVARIGRTYWRQMFNNAIRLQAVAGDVRTLNLLNVSESSRNSVRGTITSLVDFMAKYKIESSEILHDKHDNPKLPEVAFRDYQLLNDWYCQYCEAAGIVRSGLGEPIEGACAENFGKRRVNHETMLHQADELLESLRIQLNAEEQPQVRLQLQQSLDQIKVGLRESPLSEIAWLIPVSRLVDFNFNTICAFQLRDDRVWSSWWASPPHYVAECQRCGAQVKSVYHQPSRLQRLFRPCGQSSHVEDGWENGPFGLQINRTQRSIRRRLPEYADKLVRLFPTRCEWAAFEICFDTHGHALARHAFLDRYVQNADAESNAYHAAQYALNKKLKRLGIKISRYQIVEI